MLGLACNILFERHGGAVAGICFCVVLNWESLLLLSVEICCCTIGFNSWIFIQLPGDDFSSLPQVGKTVIIPEFVVRSVVDFWGWTLISI